MDRSSKFVQTGLDPERRRSRSALACGLLALLFAALPLFAQAEAQSAIVGTIVDQETHRPVDGAVVSIVDTDLRTLTDSQGKFLFRDVPSGIRVFQADHVAYGQVVHALSLPAGRTVEVRLEVAPQAIAVDPIVVTAVRHPRLQVRGFYDRRDRHRALGLGEFITEEEIRQWPAARLSSLVARVPMVRTTNLCPRPQIIEGSRCMDFVILSSSAIRWKRLSGGGLIRMPCPADVWINGVPARTHRWGPGNTLVMNMGIDEMGIPSEVAGVEVYRRASELPAEFGGATDGCGAVVIWTK